MGRTTSFNETESPSSSSSSPEIRKVEEDQELTPAGSQITPESEPQTRSFRKRIKTKTYRSSSSSSSSSSSVLEETRVLESLKKVLAEIEAHDHHYDDTALSSLFNGQDRLGNDGSSNDSCYLEIQIQNQTTEPLLNLTLNLLPQDQTQDNQEEGGESITRKIEQIQLKHCATRTPTGAESDEQIMPGDIRQYAFKVFAKGRRRKQENVRQYELEISWTSLMGERGRVRRRIEADEPTTTTLMPTRPTSERPTTTMMMMMMMGIKSSVYPMVVAQSRFFKAKLLRDAQPIVVGVPFQVELRISSPSHHPQIGPGSEPHSRLQAVLASPLLMDSLRIHDIHPLLLLLSPQPLLPLSSPAHPETAPSSHLSKAGIQVTVLKRSASLRPGGHTISVVAPGIEVLELMGLMEQVEQRMTTFDLNFNKPISSAPLRPCSRTQASDRVDLVHENDRQRMLSDHPQAFTDVLLDQLAAADPDEPSHPASQVVMWSCLMSDYV
ncbi:hypothetical protein PGTUg99_035351 [Puccinia graminis f. sp. tritici]|uniref:Trafficking protein particle complex subunit 13 middle domain-containing protein n=1 Tax=Puccinia graminis f. sp. tritici TaxID=56615 RepID=A0A5B0R9C9_PUCGR|nr:hypothetical protein PGTUg99_035351 [Puccinia graminis f. sp. tritici]